MVSIEEVHSEVVLGAPAGTPRRHDSGDKPTEVQIEELREVVRSLLAEEFDRALRIDTADSGWLG